jgi:hypothetical protein
VLPSVVRSVGLEPNKIHNIHDVEDNNNNNKKDNPTTGTTDFDPDPDPDPDVKEECVPSITVSEFNKLDGGNIPLSSCSSFSRKQICINNNININIMKKSSSSIDKKTGVCTDINNVPLLFKDRC